MCHYFVAKFFEPSYAKALTNYFERPNPRGVVLALGEQKAGFVLSVPAFSFSNTDLQFVGSCYQ